MSTKERLDATKLRQAWAIPRSRYASILKLNWNLISFYDDWYTSKNILYQRSLSLSLSGEKSEYPKKLHLFDHTPSHLFWSLAGANQNNT